MASRGAESHFHGQPNGAMHAGQPGARTGGRSARCSVSPLLSQPAAQSARCSSGRPSGQLASGSSGQQSGRKGSGSQPDLHYNSYGSYPPWPSNPPYAYACYPTYPSYPPYPPYPPYPLSFLSFPSFVSYLSPYPSYHYPIYRREHLAVRGLITYGGD